MQVVLPLSLHCYERVNYITIMEALVAPDPVYETEKASAGHTRVKA